LIYRPFITIDFGKTHNDNARHKLFGALIDAGWNMAETTAFSMETNDLNAIWRGIGLVARGAAAGGVVTAISFNAIGSEDFSKSREYVAKRNYPRALEMIEDLPFPQ
jgi:hypothetical protein